jgi:hypothetical protein
VKRIEPLRINLSIRSQRDNTMLTRILFTASWYDWSHVRGRWHGVAKVAATANVFRANSPVVVDDGSDDIKLTVQSFVFLPIHFCNRYHSTARVRHVECLLHSISSWSNSCPFRHWTMSSKRELINIRENQEREKIRLGGLGDRRKIPQRGSGGTPTANDFYVNWHAIQYWKLHYFISILLYVRYVLFISC